MHIAFSSDVSLSKNEKNILSAAGPAGFHWVAGVAPNVLGQVSPWTRAGREVTESVSTKRAKSRITDFEIIVFSLTGQVVESA